ncbi:MAG: hypothetical protein ABII71_04655 [Candidatus Micrarchaeota archaeon]
MNQEKKISRQPEAIAPKNDTVIVPAHLRKDITLCAWHPGGKALVEKNTGRKLTEKEIDSLGLKGVNSDGICSPCVESKRWKSEEVLEEKPRK